MTIEIIRTEEDYKKSLSRIEELMDAEPNTPEGDELELLVTLVERYEEKEYPIKKPVLDRSVSHVVKEGKKHCQICL